MLDKRHKIQTTHPDTAIHLQEVNKTFITSDSQVMLLRKANTVRSAMKCLFVTGRVF
uniref:Uncharacterized protein n=1 Tax=Anguilla anguilla TaxID=7936 RepID=A0A0E9TWK5_ANGAN